MIFTIPSTAAPGGPVATCTVMLRETPLPSTTQARLLLNADVIAYRGYNEALETLQQAIQAFPNPVALTPA